MNESRNNLETGLAHLQTFDADPHRVERIRARCLAALEAQRRRNRGRTSFVADWRRWLEPAAALGLSALYLAAAISSSIALFR